MRHERVGPAPAEPRATRPPAPSEPRHGLHALQRAAGNRAVARSLQREPAAAPPAAPDRMATLDEHLDAWNTPEDEVITLLGQMSGAEKARVLAGYRDKLAGCLDVGEMKRAVVALGANLATKLDWLDHSVTLGLSSLISYGEIRDLVRAAPKAERDQLRTLHWQSFFTSVCTNATIVDAVTDLGFDLPTQLRWLSDEASPRFTLDLGQLRPLLTGRSPADIAAVGTEDWLPFWSAVCTDETMEQLVTILFPTDLAHQLSWMDHEGTSAERVAARISASPPDQRLALYAAPGAVALIRSYPPPEQARIVALLGGTPVQQLNLLGPTFPVDLITWPTPAQDWIDALVAGRGPLDTLTFAGTDTAWAPFIRTKLAAMFRGRSETVHGADMVNMVWAAYGDGTAFPAADSLVVFRALFGRGVDPPGDVIFPNGTGTRQRYVAMVPDDDAARELMRMVRTIPRTQVAACPIAFANQAFDETLDPATGAWNGTPASFGTSFFWQDHIVVKVSAGGQMQANPIGTYNGEGTAYGAPGTAGPGGPLAAGNALTYFQNHVRHEIGHAIGQRPIGEMSESGDTFAHAFGGWAPSSQAAFTNAMWAPQAMPASGWPTIDFGGGPVPVTDTEVRDWLVGLLATGGEVAGPVKNGTFTMRQKIQAISASMWGAQPLTRQLAVTLGNDPASLQDSNYMFPGFTPPSPVHLYSTREGGQFVTYSKAAHDALHQSTGWYSLSSHKEMFAELYTRRYSGGGTPPAVNGKDFGVFFTELEAQDDPMFGAPDAKPVPAVSPGPGPGPS